MNRPTHRVSVKIALFNEARDRILMTVIPDGRYGLPGGHLEYGETPRSCLSRELREELGLEDEDYTQLVERGFWREKNGDRVILAYSGILKSDTVFTFDPNEVIDIAWTSRGDVEAGSISSETYNEFMIDQFIAMNTSDMKKN